MYKNYLLVAWRNLRRNKLFSFISILGLALGMTCCFLILLYVRNELSYDRFHKNADRIYRTTYLPKFAGVTKPLPFLPPPAAPMFKDFFPEIGESARLFRQAATIALGKQKFPEQQFFFADPAILKSWAESGVAPYPKDERSPAAGGRRGTGAPGRAAASPRRPAAGSRRWPRCRTALGASGPQQSPSVVARAIGLGVSATRRERSARWLPYWPRSCYGDPCPRCGDDCFGGSAPTLTREEVGKAKTSSEAQA